MIRSTANNLSFPLLSTAGLLASERTQISRQLCCRMLQIRQILKAVMQAYNSVQKGTQEAEVQIPEH